MAEYNPFSNWLKTFVDKTKNVRKNGGDLSFDVVITMIDGKKDKSLRNGNPDNLVKMIGRAVRNNDEISNIKITLINTDTKKIEWSDDYPLNQKKEPVSQSGLGALGEAEILGLIEQRATEAANKRFDEISRQKRLEDLEKENGELRQQVEELETQNDELQESLDKITNTQNMLRGVAGLLKEVGFKKIPERLEGFLGADENEKQISDNSGIVEDGGNEKNLADETRRQLISNITEYLHSLDNRRLANIYLILGEIQGKPGTDEKIMDSFNIKQED